MMMVGGGSGVDEVMEEVCEKEVLAFLDKLEQAGILEEV